MNSISKKERILQALLSGEKLSKLDILRKIRCLNSGGRVYDLRKEGWPIKTEMKVNKRTGEEYAVYSIPNEALVDLRK